MIEIRHTKKYGRGLFATRNIKKGEVVEVSPIILLTKEEHSKVTGTIINCYVFGWGADSALALGLGSLFNHSKRNNVVSANQRETRTIIFTAKTHIKKGRQLFINYGYDPIYGMRVTRNNVTYELLRDCEDLINEIEYEKPKDILVLGSKTYSLPTSTSFLSK